MRSNQPEKPINPFLPDTWVNPSQQHRNKGIELTLPKDWDTRPSLLGHRAYQRVVFKKWKEAKLGLMALLWRRQGGKTTTLAELAVRQMLRPGRLVTFASVSLLCGRELVYKEAQVFLRAFGALRKHAAEMQCLLDVYDTKTGQKVSAEPRNTRNTRNFTEEGADGAEPSTSPCHPVTLSPPLPVTVAGVPLDTFAELYESQRLEFRLEHPGHVISRTLIIAPNPATARGWTGDVIIDEIGFIRDFQEVWEAMEPIVSSDKTFRVIMSTTPPEDDAHYAFELLAPPTQPTNENHLATLPPCHPFTPSPCQEDGVNPAGHWYRSATGIWVHRCDIFDAAAAGAPVFDLESREALTPQEHFARALDKEAWRRNYGLQFLPGGASAVPLDQLAHAQAAGDGQGLFVQVENDADMQAALEFLRAHLADGPVGVGWDLATTEKLLSNPSALAVIESAGDRFIARLVLVWKTADAAVAEGRVRAVLECIAERRPARRLCIDASNEKLFAGNMQTAFSGTVLVEPVVAGATVKMPGQKEAVTFKVLLGHELLAALHDGRLALPPGRYMKDDFRLVKRNRGSFETELNPQGMHGDTFDACKLALRAVTVKAPGAVAMVG